MRIAIYSRKSKETNKGESIENQVNMCKDYFTRKYDNCEFEVFEDEGFSGGNTNRPAFKRMLQLAKHGQFDVVACYRIDRIARNVVEFFKIFGMLEESNVMLVSIKEDFDPATPTGKMIMSMLANIAEIERVNIAQRIKDNMFELGKMGRWSGGTCPTGYRSVAIENGSKIETYLEMIPECSELIEGIFNLCIAGESLRKIGQKYNISNKTISNIINNPTYCPYTEKSANYLKSIGYGIHGEINGKGFLSYNRRPKVKGKKLWKPEGMFVAASIHDTFVSDETWIKANEALKARSLDPTARPTISKTSFLSRTIKCKCGYTMILESKKRSDGSKIFYFRCSGKKNGFVECDSKWLKVDKVEKETLELIKKIAYNDKLLNKYLNQNNTVDYDKEMKKIKKEIDKKSKEIAKLTERLILIEGPAVNIVTEKINIISSEVQNLNEKLFKIEKEKISSSKEINIEDLKYMMQILISNFDILSIEEKQLIIKEIILKIQYDGEKCIDIVFR